MADIGQEVGLGPGGALRLRLRLAQGRVLGHLVGDVAADVDDAHRDAVLTDQLGVGLQPDPVTVLVSGPAGDDLAAAGILHHPHHGRPGVGMVVGMHQADARHPDQFVGPVAEHRFHRRREVGMDTFQVRPGDDVGDVVGQHLILVKAVIDRPLLGLGGGCLQGPAGHEDHRQGQGHDHRGQLQPGLGVGAPQDHQGEHGRGGAGHQEHHRRGVEEQHGDRDQDHHQDGRAGAPRQRVGLPEHDPQHQPPQADGAEARREIRPGPMPDRAAAGLGPHGDPQPGLEDQAAGEPERRLGPGQDQARRKGAKQVEPDPRRSDAAHRDGGLIQPG